jgi:hypothetical protein
MIGKTIQYNADHTAEVIDQNDTHLLVRLNTGDRYCIKRVYIDKKQILR